MTDPREPSTVHPQRSERTGWWRAVGAIFNPAGRIEPSEPHKELRFTRAHQAVHFAILAILGLAAAFALALLAWSPWSITGEPLVRPWWMALLPLPMVLAALWAMVWCATHAYILLSPAGVEVFPLFFPERGFRLIPWSQISRFRIEHNAVALDFPGGGGIVLGLYPLPPSARPLLVEALQRRLAARTGTFHS